MNCPKCHQPTENGAAFCGNCGQPLQAAGPKAQPAGPPPPAPPPMSPIARVINNPAPGAAGSQPQLTAPVPTAPVAAGGVPSYAVANPAQHAGETKALLSLLFGVAGLVGALFMALIGLALGVTGIVMGTMSRSSARRGLSTAGLVVSSLAVLAGLAVWTYAIKNDPRLSQNTKPANHNVTAPAVVASEIKTPCYSAGLTDKFSVSNAADSCDMKAFNGTTMDSSTDAYKIYADTSQIVNPGNYAAVFKSALDKDVKDNLPNFTTDSETVTKFAGSPAYVIKASDKTHDVAVIEAAVLHQVSAGDNVFILVHAINGQSADLNVLEAQWQWK